MTHRGACGVLLGAMLCAPVPALAQQGPAGALLLGRQSGWGYACPEGSAVLEEFNLAGIPLDVFEPNAWQSADFWAYNMIFLEDCQDDATYDAWNARLADLDAWVADGGFLAVHATRNCGGGSSIQPLVPGGDPVRVADYANQGDNLVPNHPILLGIPAVATGTSLSHDEYPDTGNPSDIVLLSSTTSGNPLLFVRWHGDGAIVYGGLTYSFGQRTCGSTAPDGQDAGRVITNEITWGSVFRHCGGVDEDGDGVGDDCDRCPGGDDAVDSDGDGVPDACDSRPTVPGDQHDGDGDGYGALCDCDDGDGAVNPGAEERCNGKDDDCDGVVDPVDSVDVGSYWVDADGDGFGDAFIGPIAACEPPAWFVERGGDCNDAADDIHPDAEETCDGVDRNCDGDPRGDTCEEEVARSGCDSAPTGAGGLALAVAALLARRRRREA